jgi:hypothetical protein
MYSTTRKIIAIAALAVLVTIGFMFIELEIKRGRTLNDSPIVLTGTARNAQAGAVLETATSIIYLDNVPSWPTDLEGKKVTATGKLVEKKYIPDQRKQKDDCIFKSLTGAIYSNSRSK